METASFDAIIVAQNTHTRDSNCSFPQIRLLPILGEVRRFGEEYISRHAALSLCHESG